MASATSSATTELSTQARIASIGKLNYLDFYGFATPPFRNTSDVASLFLNGQLSAAQARLDSILNDREGGIIVVNGAPGSGKTTLASHIADQRRDRDLVAKINRTLLERDEFLQILLHSFEIPSDNVHTPKQALERFDTFLKKRERQKKRVILVIDEAQNLNPDLLDMIPQLLRPMDDNRPGLFIILVGQDAFEQTLVMHGSRQLKEMILFQTYLTKLNSGDTVGYIQHQLNMAGLLQENPLSERAMLRIHQLTGGSMRLINTLCDFVFFNASMGRIRRITPDLVQTTFNALQWEPSRDTAADTGTSKSEPPPQPRLILEFRDNSEYPIDKETVTVGRATDNHICIRDLRISRYHARFTTSRKGISVEDLGSTNGVYVNRERVKVRLLQNGDLVAIDEHRMRFQGPSGT